MIWLVGRNSDLANFFYTESPDICCVAHEQLAHETRYWVIFRYRLQSDHWWVVDLNTQVWYRTFLDLNITIGCVAGPLRGRECGDISLGPRDGSICQCQCSCDILGLCKAPLHLLSIIIETKILGWTVWLGKVHKHETLHYIQGV